MAALSEIITVKVEMSDELKEAIESFDKRLKEIESLLCNKTNVTTVINAKISEEIRNAIKDFNFKGDKQ